jgi:hypothetical protein
MSHEGLRSFGMVGNRWDGRENRGKAGFVENPPSFSLDVAVETAIA